MTSVTTSSVHPLVKVHVDLEHFKGWLFLVPHSKQMYIVKEWRDSPM